MKGINEKFCNALTGFALGLFPTLIAGNILRIIGLTLGNEFGRLLVNVSDLARGLVGVGIGIGVAAKLEAGFLTMASSAIAGYIGEYIVDILEKQKFPKNIFNSAEIGLPICAFLAAFIATIIGKRIGEGHKFSCIYLPIVSITAGIAVAYYVGKYVSMAFIKC